MFEMGRMSFCPAVQIIEILMIPSLPCGRPLCFISMAFGLGFSWNGHKTNNSTSHRHLEVVAVVVIIVVSSGELEASVANQFESRRFISRHGSSIL